VFAATRAGQGQRRRGGWRRLGGAHAWNWAKVNVSWMTSQQTPGGSRGVSRQGEGLAAAWWALGQHENQWDRTGLYTPSETVRGESNGEQRTRGKDNPCTRRRKVVRIRIRHDVSCIEVWEDRQRSRADWSCVGSVRQAGSSGRHSGSHKDIWTCSSAVTRSGLHYEAEHMSKSI
jgi:hypothetical protein